MLDTSPTAAFATLERVCVHSAEDKAKTQFSELEARILKARFNVGVMLDIFYSMSIQRSTVASAASMRSDKYLTLFIAFMSIDFARACKYASNWHLGHTPT